MNIAIVTTPDARIRVSQEFNAEVFNIASVQELPRSLYQLATSGDFPWIALVSDSVEFTKNSQGLIDAFLESEITMDMFYSDSRGRQGRSSSNLRTDYCSERIRSQDYLGPVVFYSSELLLSALEIVGEVEEDFAFALALEASFQAKLVGHLSAPLYFEMSEKRNLTPVESDIRKKTVQAHLNRHGGGLVESVLPSGTVKSRRIPTGEPLISIVMPTRGIYSEIDGKKTCFVVDAVRSILEKSLYREFEIVIVADAVAEPAVLAQLNDIAKDRLRLVTWEKPFNFSEKMNFGVLHAQGEFVLLLNDDVEVISPEWLGEMLALAQLPNAGMVGAMLYYDDDTIQHAGHAYYQGSPTHIGLGLPRGASGPGDAFLVDRRVSGVTAACALMPLEVFKEVGGFTALLPGNFNDVDLCLKVGWRGYDIYWTPRAELYHFESKTRDAHVHYYEFDVIERRWGLRLDDQRFWRGHPSRSK